MQWFDFYSGPKILDSGLLSCALNKGVTNLDEQLKGLYCADDPSLYEKCLIRPIGQIDRQAMVDEKANIDQIVAALGLKEMTKGTLIRKLCTY